MNQLLNIKRCVQCLLILISLSLIACSDDENVMSNQVADISISPQNLIVANLDSSYDLNLEAVDTKGNLLGSDQISQVTWQSSDDSVATVNALGQVSAQSLGKVTITAIIGNVSESTNVEIVLVDQLSISPASATISALDTTVGLNLLATTKSGRTIMFLDNVDWQSSDENVATVDADGNITSLQAGQVQVTASFGDANFTSEFTIDDSGISIRGKVQYEDKLYNKDGFLNSQQPSFKSVRFATVDLLDENENIIETIATDNNGFFFFSPYVPSSYKVRVLAEIAGEPAKNFRVMDLNKSIYAVTKSYNSSDTNHDIKILQSTKSAGAFNILDVVTFAAEYAQEKLSVTSSDLSIFWEQGNLYGTYYCTGFDIGFCSNSTGIYVLSDTSEIASDTDEFDDDVLLHEFGHYLMETFAKDDSIGGCHRLTQNDLDLRLAWSEGWGGFIPAAIKDWLSQTNPTLLSSVEAASWYVDTDGEKALITHDIDQVADSNDTFYYASNELSVSKILWDIHTTFSDAKIWQVVSGYFPSASTPTNLATFWDGLLESDLYQESELGQLETIFNGRQVFFQDDVFEPNLNIADATNYGVNATLVFQHNLYRTDTNDLDLDLFTFRAEVGKNYTIRTDLLRNGADTNIRILDNNGAVVVQNGVPLDNDDIIPRRYKRADPDCDGTVRVFNDSNSLASLLNFSASLSDQFYVEVTQSRKDSDKTDFTGHYGSYKLYIESE